jgi:hypothetical protein
MDLDTSYIHKYCSLCKHERIVPLLTCVPADINGLPACHMHKYEGNPQVEITKYLSSQLTLAETSTSSKYSY